MSQVTGMRLTSGALARGPSVCQRKQSPACQSPSRRAQVSVYAVASIRSPSRKVAEQPAPASDLASAAQMLERSLEASALAPRPTDAAEGEPLSASSSSKPAGKREIILVMPGETLHSTWEHRAWVAGGLTILGALFAQGASQVHDAPSAAAAAVSVGTAYLFAGMPASPKTVTTLRRVLRLSLRSDKCRRFGVLTHVCCGFALSYAGLATCAALACSLLPFTRSY